MRHSSRVGIPSLREILQDIRYGLRTLAKRPAFTAVAVLALALGIGANATIFSVANGLLLRPLTGAEDGRAINIHARGDRGSGYHAFSYLEYLDYRADNEAFLEVAAWRMGPLSFAAGDEARLALGQLVSENFFDVFDVEPHLGRFFVPAEGEGLEAHPVVVLGHGLFEELGGSQDVVGTTVYINGRAMTVVGVAPPGFSGALGAIATEAWLPITMQPVFHPTVELENRSFVWLEMVGRLAPGYSKDEAEAFMSLRHGQILAAHPPADGVPGRQGGIHFSAISAAPGSARGGVSIFLGVLMAAVGLLLVITCVNVAGMLLARAAERRREIGLRLALGAGRARLVRQLVTESLLLFVFGGAAGTVFAHWASRLFLTVDVPIPVPLALELGIDTRVLFFTLAVTLLVGLAFGLAPALQATRVDLVSSLKDEGSSDGPRRLRLRGALVVAQVAVSLLLLIGAGLFLRALDSATAIDPGFDPEGVHIASLDLKLHGYDETAGETFYGDLIERVRALPGVEAAGYARVVPLGLSNSGTSFNVPGHEPPSSGSYGADTNTVSPGYFGAMRVPLLAGREFTAADRDGGPLAIIVNATLARQFWPDENPVGREVLLGSGDDAPRAEIVGVAADGKYRSLGEEPRRYIYVPFAQSYRANHTLHVRAAPGVPDVPQAVRREIRALDPNLPLLDDMPLAEYIRVSLLPQRLASVVTGLLGVLGLLLAGIGVYGVTAFAVSQRTREFGVRVALGARARDVLSLVLGQGLRLAMIGVGIGLAGAFASTRLLVTLLPGTSATDPWVFGGTSLVLIAIVLAASFVPAWRASTVDPLRALRYE